MTIDRQHRKFREYSEREKRKWARDNLPCWLCGRALRYDVAGLEDSCEGDHVTAVAAGGHVFGPLKPACRRCNQARGAMSADAYRAKLKGQQIKQQHQASPIRRTTYWGDMKPPSEFNNIPPMKWY